MLPKMMGIVDTPTPARGAVPSCPTNAAQQYRLLIAFASSDARDSRQACICAPVSTRDMTGSSMMLPKAGIASPNTSASCLHGMKPLMQVHAVREGPRLALIAGSPGAEREREEPGLLVSCCRHLGGSGKGKL